MVPNPVEDALDSYEKALQATEFRGKNHKGRLFNPSLEELKDHQKEKPNTRFSDEINGVERDIYEKERDNEL